MAGGKQLNFLLILLLFIQSSFSESSKEDLDSAEANGKLEIVKQIKKVNDDGSYTIGYEADDGSFKIESRDVLGNIKGTYGYIDENGDIKRVTYNTNNNSEVVSKPEPISVVQRIPKLNRTSPLIISSTTRRPIYIPTVPTTQSTPVVIQAIPKKRTTTEATTTTDKYSDFIQAAVEASRSITNKPVYENTSPRILLQRPLLRSDSQKSEGQIIRPDTNTRPTETPLYRRPKPTLLEKESKPITEEEDGHKNNLLRRQLPLEKNNFNPREHLINLQQSHGGDVVDVYSASLTTGTPRPLFTTVRPKYISSTVSPLISRPTRYPYIKKDDEYASETTENVQITPTTSSNVVQIPATKDETVVAISEHGRMILVPLSQIQEEYENEYKQKAEYVPYYVKRYQQQEKFRAIPVRIDENGYVRETQYQPSLQQVITPSVQMKAQYQKLPMNDYIESEDDINSIKPPVSTRDFQKLLEQLILRQSRLEQINFLTNKYQQMFGQRSRPIYRNGQRNEIRYVQADLEQQNLYSNNYNTYVTPESYTPNRRVARLLSPQQQKDNEADYLPSDVREMLLLRMLQLAINPGLPLNVPDSFEEATTSIPRLRKTAVRNVEILGEEEDDKISNRNR